MIRCLSVSSLDKSERDIVEATLGYSLYTREWDCDIRSILSESIGKHDAALHSAGHHWRCFPSTPAITLRAEDLLTRDINLVLDPFQDALTSKLPIVLASSYNHLLDANHAAVRMERSGFHVIGINVGLISYLNFFFMVLQTLTSFDRYDGCLDEDKVRLDSPEYDDAALLVGIANKSKIFADSAFTPVNVQSEYLGQPYFVCEKIEAARRFIALHELGHCYFAGGKNISTDLALGAYWRENIETHIGGSLAAESITGGLTYCIARFLADSGHCSDRDTVIECWCDIFAVFLFLRYFEETIEVESTIYECKAFFAGVIELMFMFDIISQGLSSQRSHRSALYRARTAVIKRALWSSDLLRKERLFRGIFLGTLGKMSGAYRFFGGLGFNLREGNLAVNAFASDQITDSGRSFINNIRGSIERNDPNIWLSSQ